MGTTDKYCLRWNDFQTNLSEEFKELRDDNDLFDISLATDDGEMQAHRVVLAACSPYFKSVIKRHPLSKSTNLVIHLRGIKKSEMKSLLDFMYIGEVNVLQSELTSFLAVGQDLQVKGLTETIGNTGTMRGDMRSDASPLLRQSLQTVRGSLSSCTVGITPFKKIKMENDPLVNDTKTDASNGNIDDEELDENVVEVEDDVETLDDYETSYNDESGSPNFETTPVDKIEQDFLITRIVSHLNSLSGRHDSGSYRCLVCSRVSRDLYNQRQHILTHMMKDGDFTSRLDDFVKKHTIQQNASTYKCLMCTCVINRGFYMTRNHFVSKHLREDTRPTDN